jgi:hypothetical protein
MIVWTWTAEANLEPDTPDTTDCRSAFLRSLSTNWELSLAFSLGHEVLKQASAAESIPQSLLRGSCYRALLQHLHTTRRIGLEQLFPLSKSSKSSITLGTMLHALI